ncbi:MAG: pantetheine-phosphate adenylyltransferase [Cardiobacteriaceae bacterium]|nr:pantetheine-phosphate adenylyltransferase [Cardiobacteriaceae bacterium]
MKRWLYAGTFDPITLGHESLIIRAAGLCDELYVAVAQETRKSTLFDGKTRLSLAQARLNALGLSNVHMVALHGLVVDLCRELEISAMVRGLRNGADFDYERNLAHINGLLNPTVETCFLLAPPEKSLISSSNVRELARLGADVSALVGEEVAQALQSALGQ